MGALVATARRQAGVTLAEMVTVVAVLAVAAALALPKADPMATVAADAMAAEVAQAVRFARREAIRTGTVQRVSMNTATQVLRVFQPNGSNSTTATHPVDKRAYEISFAGNGLTRGTVTSAVFKYELGTTTNTLSFMPDGTPGDMYKIFFFPVVDPLREDGEIRIRYGNVERVVRVAAVTGRVSF